MASGDQNEPRRYALLQAAAIIQVGGFYMVNGMPAYWENTETSVDLAQQLLAEIEKREKESNG